MSTSKSKLRSERLSGRRITLSFERIGDTYWSHAAMLRAFVAELDRLEVADEESVQLRHRTDSDELGPVGWSLNITAAQEPTDHRGETTT